MANNPVSCPFDASAQGSNVPCPNDTVINTLRELLGDSYINAFLIDGQSPATVGAGTDPTTLAMTLGSLSNLAITAAIIILVVSIWKWVTNSSNDGDAVGISDRGALMGMFGRPLFALTLLAPTASGYPVINIIIVSVVMWANGATNKMYGAIAERYIKPPPMDFTNGNQDVFLAASDVTDAYITGATTGYCLLRMKKEGANVTVRGKTDKETNTLTLNYRDGGGKLSNFKTNLCGSFEIERFDVADFMPDPNNKMISGNGLDQKILKNIKTIQSVQAKPMHDLMTARTEYSTLAYMMGMRTALGLTGFNEVFTRTYNIVELTGPKTPENPTGAIKVTVEMSNAGTNLSQLSTYLFSKSTSAITRNAGRMTGIPAAGWSTESTGATIANAVDITKILEDSYTVSALLRQKSVDAVNAATQAAADNEGAINTALTSIRNDLFSQGWMNAGNAQAKLRQMSSMTSQKIGYKPYKAKFVVGIPQGDLAEESAALTAVLNISDVSAAISKVISDELPDTHPAQITLATQIASANIASGSDNLSSIDNLTSSVTGGLHNMNESLISTIVDTNNTGQDTLTRIQSFGEWMLVAIGSVLLAMIVIRVGLAITMTGTSAAEGATFGLAGGLAAAARNFNDLVDSILLAPLKDLMDSFFLISRIFGVVIPSMPYIFLILAGIGWFVQIVQTMFGMPLWLIMHSIPEKSFIGSQQQGYVTLLALLFRPILIISGFFIAFDLYDPLVVFATTAFFDSYGTISGATSSGGVSQFLIYLTSLKYWYYLYAGVLMGITYIVFGLVQELSDTVLDWLGTNLLSGFGNMDSKSMVQGVSGAMSQSASRTNNGFASALQMKKEARAGGGGGGGDDDKDKDKDGKDKDVTDSSNTSSNSGSNPVIARAQEGDSAVNAADTPASTVTTDDGASNSQDPSTTAGALADNSKGEASDRDSGGETVNDSGSEINDQNISGSDDQASGGDFRRSDESDSNSYDDRPEDDTDYTDGGGDDDGDDGGGDGDQDVSGGGSAVSPAIAAAAGVAVGASIRNANGSTTTKNPDGSVTTRTDSAEQSVSETEFPDGSLNVTSVPSDPQGTTTSVTTSANGSPISDSSSSTTADGVTMSTNNDYANGVSTNEVSDKNGSLKTQTDLSSGTVTQTVSGGGESRSDTTDRDGNLLQTTQSDANAGTESSVTYAQNSAGENVAMASTVSDGSSQTVNSYDPSTSTVSSTETPLDADGVPTGEGTDTTHGDHHIGDTGVATPNTPPPSAEGGDINNQVQGLTTGSKRLDAIATAMLTAVTALAGGETDVSGTEGSNKPTPKAKSKAQDPAPIASESDTKKSKTVGVNQTTVPTPPPTEVKTDPKKKINNRLLSPTTRNASGSAKFKSAITKVNGVSPMQKANYSPTNSASVTATGLSGNTLNPNTLNPNTSNQGQAQGFSNNQGQGQEQSQGQGFNNQGQNNNQNQGQGFNNQGQGQEQSQGQGFSNNQGQGQEQSQGQGFSNNQGQSQVQGQVGDQAVSQTSAPQSVGGNRNPQGQQTATPNIVRAIVGSSGSTSDPTAPVSQSEAFKIQQNFASNQQKLNPTQQRSNPNIQPPTPKVVSNDSVTASNSTISNKVTPIAEPRAVSRTEAAKLKQRFEQNQQKISSAQKNIGSNKTQAKPKPQSSYSSVVQEGGGGTVNTAAQLRPSTANPNSFDQGVVRKRTDNTDEIDGDDSNVDSVTTNESIKAPTNPPPSNP